MTQTDQAVPVRPAALTPLWIFSIFLGFCEVTAGAVASILDGWVQAMFAIFTVSFPVVVLATFLLILWKKPIVLYAPRDFPGDVDVAVFAQVMRHNLNGTIELAGETAASSATAVAEELLLSPAEAQALATKAKTAAEINVRSKVAKVDLSVFLGAGNVLDFVVTDTSTVSDLLNSIYAAIHRHVPRYTYGISWLLSVESDGRLLRDMGTNWALNTGHGRTDTRNLIELGIVGGMDLRVVRPE
jgi:hypothetical protein